MFVQIAKVLPLVSRDYTDRQGNNQKFYSKGFIFSTSEGSLYVEAVQEQAQELEKLGIKEKDCAMVQVGSVARSYKDSSNNERFSNEVTIKRFVLV